MTLSSVNHGTETRGPKLAVVTGGTRGIGRAIATRLRDDGARVIVTGRSLDNAPPAGCELRVADFADAASTGAFAATVAELAPDILVNNAGINRLAPFAEISPQAVEDLHRVNVLAPMRLIQAALPAMRARRWGRIVNISSIWGLRSIAGRAAYSASKFGLDGLTAAIAAEVAIDDVLVNCVAPGFVDSELLRRVNTPQQIEALVAQVPMKRLARPEEIAAFVAWLAGPGNTFISGQNLPIDGGYTRT